MRGRAVCWAVVISLVLLASQAAFGQTKAPIPMDIYGGFDEFWNYWLLTDEAQVQLEDGDVVMIVWAGPDGAMDPPVRASGSPLNGQPTGDDEEILSGQIEYGYFALYGIPTWAQGDTDSLGRQRRPALGDRIYVRVFNDDDLTLATAFGESQELYEVQNSFGEEWKAPFYNDPDGPTTNQVIYGRFFKVIGGIDPGTGQTFKLRDPATDLADGSLAQLVYAGANDLIDGLDPGTRMPGGDDELIGSWGVNEGMYPSTNTGAFKRFTASYDSASHGRPAQDDKVYVRLWNQANILEASYYGNSMLYDVTYVIGESLSVFIDAAVDCDTAPVDEGVKDLTIHGGEDLVLGGFWPLVDVFGLRLKDDDLVQYIYAGADGEIDPLDDLTGAPTDDDTLLEEFGIGEGIAGTGLGRFVFNDFTYETHKKGGMPAQGDQIYLRCYDGSTIGTEGEATRYGESELYEVQWEFGEEFYAFPDSVFDATVKAPWYRTIKIFGGTDTSMAEYPLTDIDGVTLEDGDMVQLIWAGVNGTVDALSTEDCSPTGDDSLLIALTIGNGYGDDTGLFKIELQTFSQHKGGFPALGDVIYLRIFNGAQPDQDATHYGESVTHTISFETGETFNCFDDDADDAVTLNPCYTAVEEWADPSGSLPVVYALSQNYPNPFNPETDIQYQIPEAGHVELVIYNVLGQSVCTMVDGHREAGAYTVRWFGTDEVGRSLSSGIYFYRLQSGDFSEVRKMVLMK